jgi:hypothetical protein
MTTYLDAPNKIVHGANGIDYARVGPDVIASVGKPEPDPQGYLRVFFAASDASRRAGNEVSRRPHGFLFQHHAEFAADVEAFLATKR